MKPELEALWRLGAVRLRVLFAARIRIHPEHHPRGESLEVMDAALVCLSPPNRDAEYGRWQAVEVAHGPGVAATFVSRLNALGIPSLQMPHGEGRRRVRHAQVGHFIEDASSWDSGGYDSTRNWMGGQMRTWISTLTVMGTIEV